MAIFRKGYRPYGGPRSHVPAFYVIARQGWGQALKSWSLRIPAMHPVPGGEPPAS
ncbi:MAG: hypothetical protein R3F05_11455 [Planctomycetota bacterium]